MQRIVLKREARRGPTGAVHTAIADGFRDKAMERALAETARAAQTARRAAPAATSVK